MTLQHSILVASGGVQHMQNKWIQVKMDSGFRLLQKMDSGFRIQVFFPEHEWIQLNGFRTGFQLTKNGFRIQVVPAYKTDSAKWIQTGFQHTKNGFRIQDSGLFSRTRNDSAKWIQDRFPAYKK